MKDRESSNEKRTDEIREHNSRVSMLREFLDLQERDRKLVAYELHDGIAQQLAATLMQFRAFGHRQDQTSEEAQASFASAVAMLSDSLEETRRLISGLQPKILDESGIVAAIEALISEQQMREEREIGFTHRLRSERHSRPLETAVFRVVQEALNNAVRHSQSAKVHVAIVEQHASICAEVRDWGIGFDPRLVEHKSFGLHGIRDRAMMLDGQATIDTAPGWGTRVTAEFPLRSSMPSQASQFGA